LFERVRHDVDGVEAAYRAAIAADPAYASAHTILGHLLCVVQQDMHGVEVMYRAAYRAAIVADPEHAMAYSNLGHLLQNERQDVDGSEAAYRTAIAADPGLAIAHSNLGVLYATSAQQSEQSVGWPRATRRECERRCRTLRGQAMV
jgi:Tfp pilus assembly protein PilF